MADDAPSKIMPFEYPLYFLVIRNPAALLAGLIHYFHENAFIALEGDFELSEERFEGISYVETTAMQHGTWQAWKDGKAYQPNFVVMPLSAKNILILDKMIPELSLDSDIWHIQIEQNGLPVFGSFDCFDDSSVLLASSVPLAFVESLVQENIVSSFKLKQSR